MAKILIRVNADARIGLGHLQRSLSLASALKAIDTECLFFTQPDEHCAKRVSESGFQQFDLPSVDSWSDEDVNVTLAAAKSHGCRAVLVDSHDLGAEYLAKLSIDQYVIARDDLALFPFPCQMVFNGNADAPELPYVSTTGNTEFLLGTEYSVLGESYQKTPPLVAINKSVGNILVVLGGTDPFGLMPRILEELAEISVNSSNQFTVTAVIGPYFQNVREIEFTAQQIGSQITLVHSPNSVHSLMVDADLAVSAAGQALYELAATGCPTVAIQIASNQAGQMKVMGKAKTIKSAGNAEAVDVIPAMSAAVSALNSNINERESLVQAGRRLIDGQGAKRIALAIQSAIN